MKIEDQQDATVRCLLLTSISTCFGHHYAHLQENKDRVTAFGVLFWFCWMWLLGVVGRCLEGLARSQEPKARYKCYATECHKMFLHFNDIPPMIGVRGDAVSWGTALQAGRSRVRFPMVSLRCFPWHNPAGRTTAMGSTQPLTEMSIRNISWRVKAVGA